MKIFKEWNEDKSDLTFDCVMIAFWACMFAWSLMHVWEGNYKYFAGLGLSGFMLALDWQMMWWRYDRIMGKDENCP